MNPESLKSSATRTQRLNWMISEISQYLTVLWMIPRKAHPISWNKTIFFVMIQLSTVNFLTLAFFVDARLNQVSIVPNFNISKVRYQKFLQYLTVLIIFLVLRIRSNTQNGFSRNLNHKTKNIHSTVKYCKIFWCRTFEMLKLGTMSHLISGVEHPQYHRV